MARPFFWPGAGLAAGILFGQAFVAFPDAWVFILILVLLPFLWFFRGRSLFLPLFVMTFVGIGILRIHEALRLPPHHLSHFVRGDWVSLEGRVASLPELKEKGKRKIYSFRLKAENLVRDRTFFRTTGQAQVFLFNPSKEVSFGNRVRLFGKLVEPRRARNPGEFDYRKYLAQQGIHALFEGYGPRSLRVLDSRGEVASPCRRGNPAPTNVLVLIQKIRNAFAQRFDSLFEMPVNALLKALILGIRKDLPEGLRDDFIKTGTTHLIAISGMNITMVAGGFFFLAICLGVPQKGAAVFGLLFTLGYVFLSGAGVPVLRAGAMASLFFLGLWLEREKDLLNGLFFAFFAILLLDPNAFFQVGFQLSFLSVLSLGIWNGQDFFRRNGFEDWLSTGIVLIGTFPLGVAYFSIFSWSSLFANLLAIPLFHLGILGGFMSLLAGGIPFLGPAMVSLTSLFLRTGLAWIHFLAAQPWGYFHLAPPSWLLIVAYYGALALVLAVQRGGPKRIPLLRPVSISLWLLMTSLFFIPKPDRGFALTIFAAGSNELLHVEFPGRRHWLVNAGRGSPSDQARWILSPFLRQKGVKQLEGVLFIDLARRHVGGLPTLLGNFSVGSILFPGILGSASELVPFSKKRETERVNLVRLGKRDQILFEGDGKFEVSNVTGDSAFLTIQFGNGRFLLLPTWKRSVIEQSLPHLSEKSPVNVLILPAWGDPAESIWEEMIVALSPDYVVFTQSKSSAAPRIRFLEREEIPYFFLSDTGALRFEVEKGGIRIHSFLLGELPGS